MPARSTDVRRRIAQVGVAIEAPPRPQADEDLARAPLQSPLQFDGVVARVENEQRSGSSGLLLSESAQQSPDLLGGDRVRFLIRTDALHIYRGGPALAHEAQLCDELVGPSCYDRLAGGVAGRMVVEAALGARLCIAAGPHADVHGVAARFTRASDGKRMTGEEPPHDFGVDPSPVERRVEATPAATMRRLEAQVGGRRDSAVRVQDGVGELEEGVASAVEAAVERVAEGVESIVRFHDASIMRSPTTFHTLHPTGG